MNRSVAGSSIIRQLIDEIERRQPAGAAAIAEFARQFFDRFPAEDLRGRSLTDLSASIFGSWHYLNYFDDSRPKVRALNPEFERHGWQSGHTVIAVLCRDTAFALDSVRAELNHRNFIIHTVHGVALRTRRDGQHRLTELLATNTATTDAATSHDVRHEAFLYFEINRCSNADELGELEATLSDILREVALVVDDFAAMQDTLQEAAARVREAAIDEPTRDELLAFIDWMLLGHFTFLGCEQLWHAEPGEASTAALQLREDSRRGLLRALPVSVGDREPMSERGGDFCRWLGFAKGAERVRVHRRIYPDFIGIRVPDASGNLLCEYRFMGLFTSRAYTMPSQQIPVLRRKIDAVIARTGFAVDSHEYNEITRILEVHPRDEIFQSSVDELFDIAIGISHMLERRLVRLFVRDDTVRREPPLGHFVTALVFMPRDLYNTDLRQRMQDILCSAFGATEAEFTTFFSESVLTRTYFVLRVDAPREGPIDLVALQDELVRASMSWHDHLRQHLVEEFGEEPGLALSREYAEAFPAGYCDDFDPRAAVADIRKITTLHYDSDIAMSFYRAIGDSERSLRFRLFHLHEPLPLSDVLPILENLGLRVIGERPYGIRRAGGPVVWVHEFSLFYDWNEGIDIAEVSAQFQEAFAHVWFGEAENDAFNKLVLGTGLGWRTCAMLRAFARYMKQINVPFSHDYIADTLVRHLPLTHLLVQLFNARFDPATGGEALSDAEREQRELRLQTRIAAALDKVQNLAEDRIIRHFLALIGATVRTNFFQRDAAHQLKPYFSFKFRCAALAELPLPKPLFEIFVYSPRVEGVHLRTSRVARGGLRWSDRLEDFRTEVLGLMKAQQVKNSIIVPTGAKGGFVARRIAGLKSRDAIQDEVIACYRLFVQGLLDLTDNLVNGAVQPPPDVLRMDEDDTYLVVAADKGTASFSDIANEIAHHYNFWLGDAFASGGSVGYDHKKMAITARGAWISVQRHFAELNIDVQSQEFTAIGIGDMSGDVFGNGLLRTRQVRLLAAFDHRHIFVDPQLSPRAGDTFAAFAERRRLFELPRSSWADYDATLISDGGGVFARNMKAIAITPQMRERFDIDADRLTPNELIYMLLQTPVDLLWNGGIGTYVKASGETHADCGDKANDAVRVNGNQLRCKVIGEGGNLGCTQLGRVEYALHGGRCNTDFIDNAGGVNCSDHEVNIKIALGMRVASGDMTEKHRRELLEAMTDAVADLVLADSARQTLALSLALREVQRRMGEYRRLIARLEAAGTLNRTLEFLPDEDVLNERRARGQALTRPELAVLICSVKSQLKVALSDPALAADTLLQRALYQAFPQRLVDECGSAIDEHRLRSEIIATQVANDMVNLMGITFADRMVQSTGATLTELALGYVAAREIYDLHAWWLRIDALAGHIVADVQLDMYAALMRMVRRATRWIIRNRRLHLQPAAEVARFREPLAQLYAELGDILEGRAREEHQRRQTELTDAGVPDDLAGYVAAVNALYTGLGIIDAALEVDMPVRKVAEMHLALQQMLELDSFAKQISDLTVENHWQALARESFRDDLEWQLRRLTVSAMRQLCEDGDVATCVQRWSEQQHVLVERWRALLVELNAAGRKEFAVYAVAIRELLDLAQSSRV
jgi:glutamate dehydrogenase